jgi:glycosyltransferase involved in cell wall biosynthesis
MIIGIDASRANVEQKTGVETYAYRIIQELKKQLPPDHQVILYSREPLKGDLADLPDNWFSKVLSWPPKKFWTQIRMSIEMLVHKPDVLFIPAHVFPLIHPKKTVMTVHDVAAMRFPQTYNMFEQWYSLWSAKVAVKKLWKIITPSSFTKSELIELVQSKKESHIHVIHHGYNEEYRKITDEYELDQIKEQFHITKPFLISVGRLEEKKNTKRIVESFNKLRESGKDLQLVLIGNPGFGYQETLQTIIDSPYKKDIIQPGWVRPREVVALMNAASVFVFPSLYEGFGLPVLEAFACETPVVAAEGSSLEEVGGDAAVYCNPEDLEDIVNKISSVLETKPSVEELNIQLGKFSWEKAGNKTVNVLLST